ncbi:hypothetical protein GYB61_02115 [bacterium]|nr:hypothetical protein [bacterium]
MMAILFGAGVAAGNYWADTAAQAAPRPALDAEIAKLTESLYVARQIDAGEVSAARDYLALSMDLDILALGEQLDSLSPQRQAAALATLSSIYTYRKIGYRQPRVREPMDDNAALQALRAEVSALLERAARQAPRGGLEF